MTYEYLYANWESIAFVIVFGAMFIGATIFGIRDAHRRAGSTWRKNDQHGSTETD